MNDVTDVPLKILVSSMQINKPTCICTEILLFPFTGYRNSCTSRIVYSQFYLPFNARNQNINGISLRIRKCPLSFIIPGSSTFDLIISEADQVFY